MNNLVHHDWPGGGTVDRIKQQLDMLAELTDEDVAQLQTDIVSEFETVEKEDPTPQTVDAMTSLADMLDTVRSEVSRREALAQELATRAAEAAMRVKGEAEGDMPEGETETPAEEEMKPAEEPAAEAPVAEEKEEEKPMAEASTAAEVASELSTEVSETTIVAETIVEAAAEVTPAAELAVEEAPAQTETVVAQEAPVVTVETTEAIAAAVETTEAVAAPVETTEAVAASVEVTTSEEAVAVEAVVEAETVVASTETNEAQTVQEDQEAPVTAAANNEPAASVEVIEAPADRRPLNQASVAPVAITAGADIPGYTAGSELSDMKAVAEAMSKRLHGLRRVNGGDGEQHIVASITTSYPEARTLTQDAEANWDKIQAVSSPEAITASGGHSAPFTVKYDIFGIGTTERPVRDALPRFQADRGGIRFITPPVLSDYDNAVGVWTNVVDTAPDTATKASLTVSAATENTVATDAVTLQLQFGNLMTRAYPELIARHNEMGLIQHAREAETQILSRLTTLSTAVTSTSLIGMGRDFLVQLGRAASQYRGRHRLPADFPLRAIIPAWIKDAMAADLTIAAPGDNTLNAYADIDAYIASRGINPTYTIDGSAMTGSQGSGAMNGFTNTFVWYLFAEGTFLFLDGGTLDLGIIRDSTLVGTNDYKMFVETFEGVAKVGVESLKVTSTINVNGVAAALRDTTGGATAAAIEY
jgi:chemotaxis protein histidine kinase CheA